MRTKHNKKRNTAFVFEALVREVTKAIIAKDNNRKNKVVSIIKEHFSGGTLLNKELKCYKALLESRDLDQYTAEKIIFQARVEHERLPQKDVFVEQSRLIRNINKELGAAVFSNFVPNYKNFATVGQIFNIKTPLKNRVLLEKEMLEIISSKKSLNESALKPVDNLVVTTFIKKFNDKYVNLLPEQRDLLNKYVISLGENYADFQLYLVEELSRIKNSVKESISLPEVKADKEMINSTNTVLNRIDSLDVSNITEAELKKVLKLQSLVREYQSDASEN